MSPSLTEESIDRPLTPGLAATIKVVADRFALTGREREVLRLLAMGVTYAPTIASVLGLRPNTIHNHFKSIFRRTNTRGKAELLALVLEITLEQQAKLAPFVRPPRVLVAISRPEGLLSVLRRVGMQVSPIAQTAVESMRARNDVDVLIVEGDGRQIKDAVDVRGPLVLTVYDGPVAPQSRSLGLLSLTDDVHRIVLAIMLHVTSDDFQRSRLLRVDADLQARVNGGARTALSNIGIGGAFVRLPPEQIDNAGIGDPLSLDVTLDDARTLSLRGTIRWQRRESRDGLPTGIGVQFTAPPDDARAQLEDFVSSRRFSAWLAPSAGGPRVGVRAHALQHSA